MKFFYPREIYREYSLVKWEKYKQGKLGGKGRIVYDKAGREIALQDLDVLSFKPISTLKKYYVEDLKRFPRVELGEEFGVIEFNYNYEGLSPGGIAVNINLPGYEHKEYYIEDEINILKEATSLVEVFSWETQAYYHKATPLIPNSIVF